MPPLLIPSGDRDNELLLGLRDRDDLLYEVLLRVPPKSVCQFRCVCKRWLGLTTSSNFVSSYASRHTINPSSWLLLGRRPLVEATATRGPGRARLSLSEPPNVSSLSISPRLCPGHHAAAGNTYHPCVVTRAPIVIAYSGGLLLLASTDAYYICNPFTGDSFRLPATNPSLRSITSVGLITRAGEYMVAELRYSCLRCFSSKAGKWEEKAVSCPEFLRRSDAVVSFNGRLHWVDLGHGILSCDPFAEKPAGRFVELPDTCVGPSLGLEVWIDKRCIGVTGGRLCFLEVDDGDGGSMRLWTLGGNESGGWVLEHKVDFPDIWADESYVDWLPQEVPMVGLVDPLKAHIVYFMADGFLFAVDASTRKVVKWYEYGSHEREAASLALMPCMIPPCPASRSPYPSGLEKKEGSIRDAEENGSCSKPAKSAKGRRKQKR